MMPWNIEAHRQRWLDLVEQSRAEEKARTRAQNRWALLMLLLSALYIGGMVLVSTVGR